MNMKKLMADVLAVVIAISAMAVNVFAETYRIGLARSSTYKNGLEVIWTFDINNYSLFGYADQNSYLELRLPTTLTKTDVSEESKKAQVNWSIEVNGASYDLKSVAPEFNAEGTKGVTYFTQYVNFGAFTHSYYDSDPTDGVIDNWATIPQSQMVGDISTIRLIAKVTYANNWDDSQATGEPNWENGFKDDNYDMYVQLWTAGDNGKNYGNTDQNAPMDDEEVTGSYTPVAFMTVNKSSNQMTEGYSFVNSQVVPDGEGVKTTWDKAWVWDHSLVNRAMIMGAESAKVVIKLANPTNGVALYSMRTADQPKGSYDTGVGVDNGYEQPWWNYGNANTEFVSSVLVDGQVSELVFDMPLEKLYNATYGIYNGGIWFTERITLQNYEPVWGQNDHYKGNPIKYEHKFSEMYIELTMPETDDEDEIEVVDPIQAGDVEDEEDNIEVTDPVDEPEDTNPPTGIVLAVLPMGIAAAAVVAAKRR